MNVSDDEIDGDGIGSTRDDLRDVEGISAGQELAEVNSQTEGSMKEILTISAYLLEGRTKLS